MRRLRVWLARLNRRLNNMSHGKKLAINLILIVLFLNGIWVRQGCPLPTTEMEFRRLERTHLLPESEIVFQTEAPGKAFALPDGPELRLEPQVFVGLRKNQVTLCVMEKFNNRWYRDILSLPRGEAPVLVPFLREGKYLEPMGWYPERISENTITTRSFLVLLLLNAPEETARAEVTVRGDGEEFSGGGWRLKDGNWLLGLESDLVGRGAIPYQNASYTLELFASDGSLLLERSGSFEEKRA